MIAGHQKSDVAASLVEDMLFKLAHLLSEEGVQPRASIRDMAEALAASHLINFVYRRRGGVYLFEYLAQLDALAKEMLDEAAGERETRH